MCFHNEHVSFAATNPIENGGAEYLGPSLVSKARKPGSGIAPGTEWEPQCCTLSGSERKPPYYVFYYCVSVLFSLICPSLLFADLCCCLLSLKSRRFRDRAEIVRVSRQHDRADGAVGKRTCQRCWCVSGPVKRDGKQKPAPRNTWGHPLLRRVANGERAERKLKKERKEKRKCAINYKKKQPETLSFLLSFSLFLGGLVCVYRTRSAPIYHCTSVLCAMRTTSGHSGWWTTPSS